MKYISQPLNVVHKLRNYTQLSRLARAERKRDRAGLSFDDPDIEHAVSEAIDWLGRAQDNSRSRDGGVARDFSLLNGWNTSYPETTGYIIPTLLEFAKRRSDNSIRERARRMLDWLVSIQFPRGGFQGSVIGATPVVPVTFNTGQILLGLASGTREFGDAYLEPMGRAADWLIDTQDPDGCWRRHPSPFAEAGVKAYETHVAWGLLEAAKVTGNSRYAEAALANVRWALSFQQSSGWFMNCCLSDPYAPLSHTLGYALRGILEAYLFTKDASLLKACLKTADGLLGAMNKDGFLPGRLDANWRGRVNWACLTGTVQIAHCWLVLYSHTENTAYRDAAFAANRYVRRTLRTSGPPETRGAVKGSFPVSGGYCTYEYPNWACKFFIDSNILEQAIREGEPTVTA